ncbi:L-threonylcarbamoyladenylate synthase [Solitalea canadensis]|uniref:L-threonylcarbamoyladenylate synthase n=1 Tax=Solitalea canadensis (strain ATCC 29591 / DSM 3403 / JCM 21819 / LMG 8368 / NBRC 15130 / NCIMB 12057 / USAM 9D) TaxID=929556 RepID=H8KXV3_SOLCM|nr:L-threonylcarbamoyladenylate synthase [Solitalea canadensis]AFD05629.1 Sua5/YciO/YrdC/YwlC family protein [Solitalea canadensis DSM 3403]
MQKEIEKSLEVIKAGGTLLYPTDTIWGLGCDATNPDAVEKIIQLKKRSGKSFIVLLDNINDLFKYVKDVPEVAYELIEVSDKPLTIVFDGGKNLAPNVLNEDGSVGIRIVKHPFCEQLIRKFRKPIVSTSANISGEPSAMSFDEVSDEIKSGVDYVVDFERSKKSHAASSIIKLGSGGLIKILRK